MLKYSPKVFLVFKLPDGTVHSSFFGQSQKLGDIIASLGVEGSTDLDQEKNIGELGLKNDHVIEFRKKKRWPF